MKQTGEIKVSGVKSASVTISDGSGMSADFRVENKTVQCVENGTVANPNGGQTATFSRYGDYSKNYNVTAADVDPGEVVVAIDAFIASASTVAVATVGEIMQASDNTQNAE